MSTAAVFRWLALGLLTCMRQGAAAQNFYEFLPDSMGQRLLRQAHVQQLRWTVEDHRYHSKSLYRALTFDPAGRRLTSQYGEGQPVYGQRYDKQGRVVETYSIRKGKDGVTAQPATGIQLRYDAKDRLIFRLEKRPNGVTDTLETFRYEQKADTSWTYNKKFTNTDATRSFMADNGRLYRYDYLDFRRPKRHPELPQYLYEVKSYYSRFDDRKRQIESGDVDFQRAIEQWLTERMARQEELPGGPFAFVNGGGIGWLQLSGKLQGEYRPNYWTHYDARNRVSEYWSSVDGLRRYRYDAAGRVSEVLFFSQAHATDQASPPNGRAVLIWGPRNLPVRVEHHSATGEIDQISTYEYLFHPATGKSKP